MSVGASIKTIRLANFAIPGSDGKMRLDWNGAIGFLRSPTYREVRELGDHSFLFSLEGFDYLNPDGLIWLLLLGDQLKLKGNSVWLQLPRDPDQLRYLKSCNFQNVALENFSIANVFYLDEVPSLRFPEGMRFFRVNLTTLATLLRELSTLFGSEDFLRQLGVSPIGEITMEFLPPFLRTIHETSKNIVQHSGRIEDRGYGYLVISPIGKSRVRLCLGDAGRGFSSSLLAKGIRARDDFDAIRHALLFRYYRPGGEGLFRVIQFVSRLGGVVRIRSGSQEGFLTLPQQLFAKDDNTRHFIEHYLKQVPSRFDFPGVQLQIDLRKRR